MVNRNYLTSYALVLFKFFKTKDQQKECLDTLNELKQIFKDNQQLQNMLNSLYLSKEEKKDIIKQVFSKTTFDKNILYWIWTIIDNNSFNEFSIICKEFVKFYEFVNNIIHVGIASAKQLSDEQFGKIKNKIISLYPQGSEFNFQLKIDPKIIAGVRIKLNNKSYDNTIQTKLTNIRRIFN